MLTDGNTCIRDAARELALPYPEGVSPFISTDALVLQLLALANAQGQELARDYSWTELQKKYTFTLVPGTVIYSLPEDFLGLIPSTAYGTNTRWEATGSLTPGQWANLTAWASTAVVGTQFRIQGRTLEVPPGTPAQTLTLAYRSSFWATATDEYPSSEELTESQPAHVFDRRLMVCAIKNAFNEARGFDSTVTRAAYERALSRAMGSDGTPPVLSVGRGGARDYLLGPKNLPPTGWGK